MKIIDKKHSLRTGFPLIRWTTERYLESLYLQLRIDCALGGWFMIEETEGRD